MFCKLILLLKKEYKYQTKCLYHGEQTTSATKGGTRKKVLNRKSIKMFRNIKINSKGIKNTICLCYQKIFVCMVGVSKDSITDFRTLISLVLAKLETVRRVVYHVLETIFLVRKCTKIELFQNKYWRLKDYLSGWKIILQFWIKTTTRFIYLSKESFSDYSIPFMKLE